jgi:hypothetical protein
MKSCCEDNQNDCLQGRDCPVYQQRRRVRAGQPAPPILFDPVEVEEEEQLSDTAAIVAVVVIILVVAACAALVVGVLP